MCTLLADSIAIALQKYTFFQYPTITNCRYLRGLFHVTYLDEVLTNLYGIEGGTLTNLVT